MATKKAAKKPAAKKANSANVNIKGTLVPDDCQTCTLVFSANLSLTPGKAKRIKILATGNPISKIALTN